MKCFIPVSFDFAESQLTLSLETIGIPQMLSVRTLNVSAMME